MKTSKTIVILLAFILSFNSCGHGNEQIAQNSVEMVRLAEANSDTESEYSLSESSYDVEEMKSSVHFSPPTTSSKNNRLVDFVSSKATSTENDGDKKFIRTAHLAIKVKDIVLATHAIEDIIIAKKGFIINSQISNDSQRVTETRVSKDSILVSTNNILQGRLNLCVHYLSLDASLREIALLVEQVQQRTVSAQDVTFDIVANRLEQKRENDKSARIKSITGANRGHKLEDMIDAEDAIDRARTAADHVTVNEMRRDDQILYSTINIVLEQEPVVTYTMRAREADVKQYSPGFFTSLGSGIMDGWNGLLVLLVGLFTIWPVLLFIGTTVFGIIYFRRRRKNSRKKGIE